jgi:hypothetical protein
LIGSDHKLAKAETAVAGWHLCVCEHSKASRRELPLQPIREVSILKAAAAQANVPQAGALGYAADDRRKDIDKAVVKTSADDAGMNAALQVIGQCDEEGSGFHLQAGAFTNCERVGPEVVAGIAAGFQRNGGLRLVGHMGSGQRQGCDRVKESAAT